MLSFINSTIHLHFRCFLFSFVQTIFGKLMYRNNHFSPGDRTTTPWQNNELPRLTPTPAPVKFVRATDMTQCVNSLVALVVFRQTNSTAAKFKFQYLIVNNQCFIVLLTLSYQQLFILFGLNYQCIDKIRCNKIGRAHV